MTDTTALTPFDNGEFRLEIQPHDADGFRVPAAQVAKALGVHDAGTLLRSIPAQEKGYALVQTLGGQQRVAHLTEAGFYRAIGQRQTGRISDSDTRAQVERFQAWVYRDVLPSIRRTGSYNATPALSGPELMAAALVEANKTLAVMGATIAQLEPKAAYVDEFVTDEDLLRFDTIASTLGIQESQLRNLLIDHGWIYKETATRWSNKKQKKESVNRYSECADKKLYFRRVENHDVPRFRNEVMHTLKITPPGALAIARCVPRWIKEAA